MSTSTIRRRTALTKDRDPPEGILDPGQAEQDQIVQDLLRDAEAGKVWYDRTAQGLAISLALYYLLIFRQSPLALSLIAGALLLLAAYDPSRIHPNGMHLLLGFSGVASLVGALVPEWRLRSVLPSSMTILIVAALREVGNQTVKAARQLEGMKYDAPEA